MKLASELESMRVVEAMAASEVDACVSSHC